MAHLTPRCVFSILITLCAINFSFNSYSFDDDYRLNDVDFRSETFLDIKSYEFGARQNHQWNLSPNGWRVAAGSLDFDRLYLHSQLKIKQDLSNRTAFHLHHEERSYYDIKPARRNEIEIEHWPVPSVFSLSVIGTPTYDKRQSDAGLAAKFSRSETQYVKLAHIQQDIYYNEKNKFDESRYHRIPEQTRIISQWQSQRIFFHLSASLDQPLWWRRYDSQNEQIDFRSHGHRYKVAVNKVLDSQLYGLTRELYSQKKSEGNGESRVIQSLLHSTYDAYYISDTHDKKSELTIGLRYDDFENRIIGETDLPSNQLTTYQAYAYKKSRITQTQSLGYGAHLGDSEKNRDRATEAKLRLSWYYLSLTKNSELVAHINFNMDEYNQWEDANDTWDGGGVTYQSMF